MRELIKNTLMSACAASILTVTSANAVVCPPIGPVIVLMPPAEAMFLQIDTAFTSYDMIISLGLKSAFGNIQSASVDVNMSVAEHIIETNQMMIQSNIEIQRTASALKMNHKGYLEQTANREKVALLSTSDDPVAVKANKDYFAKLCALKKTSDGAFGSASRGVSLSMSRNMLGEVEFSARGVLAGVKKTNAVEEHYRNFCTKGDQEQGLCEEVAKIPNADLLAFVFLRPMNEVGKGVVKSISMKTEYTYSDYEMEAAKSFMAHAVPSYALKRPPIGDETKPANIPYMARYNQLKSMNNLAGYAFSKAFNNRVPIVDTAEVRLSRLDQIRVMLTKARSTDLESISNSNARGKMIYVLNQMALDNMLDEEIADIERLNSDLLAALLSDKNNNLEIIGKINSVR